MDLTTASVIDEHSRGSFAMKHRRGNTNGLSRQKHRTRGKIQQRDSFSAMLLLLGAVMYGAAMMWPLASMSPSWVSYPLAIFGVLLLLLSLRNMWERSRHRGYRT